MNLIKFIQPRLNYSFSFKNRFIAIRTLLFNSKPDLSRLNHILDSRKIYYFDHARSGLQLLLSTLPLNSRVGVQPFTCPTVLQAIVDAKCIVVFVDINKQLVVDCTQLQQHANKLDALIVTHTFGYPVNVSEIRLSFKNILLIEDCAHAFLSEVNQQIVGKVGDFALFSHGFAKFPSALRGGFLTVNNPAYLDVFESKYKLVSTPRFTDLVVNLLKSYMMWVSNNVLVYSVVTSIVKRRRNSDVFPESINPNEIMTGFRTCQAVLQNILTDIERQLAVQQGYGRRIVEALKLNANFEICQSAGGLNYFMVPVLVQSPDRFIAYARDCGIEIGRHFVRSQNAVAHYGYIAGSCPNYEMLLKKIVTIPSHCDYSETKITKLLTMLKAYSNE